MQPPPPPPPLGSESSAPSGERKRKSRWGDKQDAAMPVAITGGVQEKDLESYALNLRLDEIGRSLKTGNVVPPDHLRSPSPPPTYDSHGRRTNTREVRYRKKLEDERMRLVERQIKLDPNYRAPAEYLMAKRQNSGRPTDKVYIPVKEFPEINFFGLLVGPRGNSLKKMERESGARISIRGKGSVKEGKGKPGHREEDETDELHCLITADSEEKVQACVKLINSVIETAASVPEGQNDHKRNQLRELASLNGTLRDDENQVCQNCGGLGHRKYDCPEQKNWSANIICRICGGAGHMARDCTQRRGGFGGPPGFGGSPGMPGGGPPGGPPSTAQVFDSEYASLMAELGETDTAPPVGGGAPAGPGGGPGMGMGMGMAPAQPLDDKGQKIPPWRIPENW
ncbi:eukaryotic type KH-domain (KH-domain type I) [Rhodotorula sp. JG-1b]|nr:eukaryotic type KH-domain (KH-domain type I) [Rhodotorula sp. JG-1b]